MLKLPASLLANPAPAQWIRFVPEHRVLVTPGKVDIGQGISSALAHLVAQELGLGLETVSVQAVSTAYSANEGMTSGSLSVQDSGTALRYVCAFLRRAKANGSYWSLPEELLNKPLVAADLDGLWEKPRSGFAPKVVLRADLPAKLRGEASFLHDLRLPGMRHALVLRGPKREQQMEMAAALVAKLNSPLEHSLLTLQEFSAFVSTRLSVTMRLAAQIAALFEQVAPAPQDRAIVDSTLNRFLQDTPSEISILQSADPATYTLEADYLKSWNCHASIGPSCAIACFHGSTHATAFTVLSHSQGVFNLRRDIFLALGEALGLSEAQIVVEHREGAGCYGHNGADDVALDAAVIAQHFAHSPIRVQWSRAQEFAQAPFSPAMLVRVKAQLEKGRVTAWSQTLWSNGHSVRPGRGDVPTLLAHRELQPFTPLQVAVNATAAMGYGAQRNAEPLYSIANLEVVSHRLTEMPVRSSAFRALGAIANVFAIESTMDQLALICDCDPLEFRFRHLDERHQPMREVLERLRKDCGWDAKRANVAGELPLNHGLGLAMARYKNTGAWCAVAALVEVGKTVSVKQLWVVADLGEVLSHDGACNQLEGAAIQATSLAIKENAGFAGESNASPSWLDYPILRFNEVPQVTVSLMDRPGAAFLGAGEPATAPTVAAIANAVAHAVGVAVRSLPLNFDAVRQAIECDL